MNVLVGCEETGEIRDAFQERGHNSWSCDLKPSRRPGNHYQCDVREILTAQSWDLFIAHPPCTFLSYAGTRYWNEPGREALRLEAFGFFMEMISAEIPRVCVENPVGYPNKAYKKPDQIIHPYFFGDPFLKRTCLWLKGLPKLWFWKEDDLFGERTMTAYPEPIYTTQRANGEIKKRHFTEASHGAERSVTFPGIARAMAAQWGGSILDSTENKI